MLSIKKRWTGVVAIALSLVTVSLHANSFPLISPIVECSCTAPSNARVTSQTQSTISLAWDPALSATGYEIWYYRASDGYSSSVTSVSGTSTSFSSLSAGVYTFYIRTNCGGTYSGYIVIEEILMG